MIAQRTTLKVKEDRQWMIPLPLFSLPFFPPSSLFLSFPSIISLPPSSPPPLHRLKMLVETTFSLRWATLELQEDNKLLLGWRNSTQSTPPNQKQTNKQTNQPTNKWFSKCVYGCWYYSVSLHESMVSASSALRYSWLALGDVEEGWRLFNLIKSHGIHYLVYCM